jgi:hypothetical protein
MQAWHSTVQRDSALWWPNMDCSTSAPTRQETAPIWTLSVIRKRTIPTERPPLVGEVIANFLLREGATWAA